MNDDELDPRRDELLLAYLRSRSEGHVPDALRVAAMRPPPAARPASRWARGSRLVAGLSAAATLVAITLIVLATLPPGLGRLPTPQPSATGRATSAPSTSPAPSASAESFPSSVAGMPVITVAQAVELLHEGNLSGRAVAVGGYFAQYFPSCPFAGGYRGPFSDFCRMVAFTDSREASTLCHPWGASGSECSWAPDGVSNLGPFFMSETSGEQSLSALYQQLPVRLVVIGHSGDARQWQCSPDKRGGCGFAFVADRVAWVDGHDVPIGAPATIDAMTGTPIQPAMSLAEVARALGVGEELLTGAPFQAKDVWTIDPRWNLVGDNLVWFVRSITAEESAADPTRPEMVWLVDDETGELLAQHDLALAADYGPARIWVNALLHGIECCPGTEPRPYYSVESSGALVHESMVSGGASGSQNVTTFGPDTPLLLDPGTYTVTSWLATYDGGVIGEPTQECSIEITLRALDDVGLHADFPLNRPCTFASGALPSPF